jgi:hypothetical protein
MNPDEWRRRMAARIAAQAQATARGETLPERPRMAAPPLEPQFMPERARTITRWVKEFLEDPTRESETGGQLQLDILVRRHGFARRYHRYWRLDRQGLSLIISRCDSWIFWRHHFQLSPEAAGAPVIWVEPLEKLICGDGISAAEVLVVRQMF